MKTKDTVFIVGGGHSITARDLQKLAFEDTIVINKSIFYVPNPTWFITLDHSFLIKMRRNRKNFSKINCPKIFVANFSKPYIVEENGIIRDKRFDDLVYNLKDFDIIIKSYTMGNFGLTWNDFRNGDNSGFCGVQLAILLGYKDIRLVGIDLNVGKLSHYHHGYGQPIHKFAKKCENYYRIFAHSIETLKHKKRDVRIYSCSPVSKLNTIIPYKSL